MAQKRFTPNAFLWLLLLGFILRAAPPAQAQCAMSCNNFVQISLDDDCEVAIDPDMILEGNGCPNGNFVVEIRVNGVWVPGVVNANHINQTLQVRVRELNSGNSCWGYILVEDKLDPQITCTNITLSCGITTYTPQYLQDELNLSAAYPTVVENCGNFTLSYIDQFTDLPCNGTINGLNNISAYVRRTWTAVDQSGNSATCSQFIYFQRRSVQQVQFPPNVTLSCESPDTHPSNTGVPFIVDFGREFPLYPQNTFCELSLTYSDQVLPICDGSYKILRTWTVLDWCLPTQAGSNPRQHIQLIEVEDDQGPQIACPNNLTVNTNPWNCARDLDLPDVLIEDNCSRIKDIWAEYTINGTGKTLAGTVEDFPGNNPWHPDTLGVLGIANGLPLGNTLMRYVVRDDCGNTATCQFIITVADQTPPNTICIEATKVALGANGMALVNASTFDKGSYDNCSPVRFKARRMDANPCQPNDRFYDQVKFCCEDVGKTIAVILRVYDIPVPNGEVSLEFGQDNANDCMVQVTVEDKLKPTCNAPSNASVSCSNFDPTLWAYGFATAIDNCCIDTITETRNLALFDTLCNRGTITRTFRVEDCGGQTASCTQRIFVAYQQDYFVRFPNDVIVTACDGTGNFGEPIFFGKDCEALAVSHQDEIFTVVSDACFLIERTWTVINWCSYNPNEGLINVPNPNPNPSANHPSNLPGPVVSPAGIPAPWSPTVVSISPGAPPTNYSIYWSANANGYRYKQIIKVIDGQKPIVENCKPSPDTVCDLTANDAALWNASFWWDPSAESHDLCEAPTDLSITATDLCSGANVNFRYLLFLDLNSDGVMETVVSSTQTGLGGLGWNRINFGNALNPGYAGGEARAFDFRSVPDNQKYGFALQVTTQDNKKAAAVRWNTQQAPNTFVVPELPYGTHKIKWFVDDGCGNEQSCEWFFEVKDCKKPTVVCKNLAVNIMPTKMVAVDLSDLLQSTSDNCTPESKLLTAVRKRGDGQGFPMLPNGQPQRKVTFTCSEIGTQEVEVWSRDLAGNMDFCIARVDIQDNMGACSGHNATVAVALTNEKNEGLAYADISLKGYTLGGAHSIELNGLSDENGQCLFSNAIPFGSSYTIAPFKNNDPLNGVSTYDLLLINRHILGIEPLSSPYKMIAADANKSRSITTLDLVELRKLILGLYTELPTNASWRFVPADFGFPTPTNPFETEFPEVISVADVMGDRLNENFVAIKVGDVNGNAIANAASVQERTAGTAFLALPERQVKKGEVFAITLYPEEVVAYQLTLSYPDLELIDIVPENGLLREHFAVFEADKALTAAIDVGAGFRLQFRALRDGALSRMLFLSNYITRSEGYDAQGQKLALALRFEGLTPQLKEEAPFELFQNAPNPVREFTSIVFFLPKPTEVTLTITDTEGRLVKRIKGFYPAGLNSAVLQRAELPAGILFYQLATPTHSATKKMFVAQD